ncbi:MAG: hypothetical protein KGZ80_08200 [Methylomonas sp.]|nr:hypothetical protein [Methylomonas sp.]PPD22596.1 MAG: hypothetical protein CTY23_01560 [Methylomonas sp.]PPD27906.1 MAG: hypothetical protein CTY22_00440 [Methylomonas sp.]PPD40016.1 MAG: hypothetical protein CTY21_00440 [Methylomonas sp.]PPD41596.1 MAG: hypothetical protein CTY17_03710 [Methylomonas sp.]
MKHYLNHWLTQAVLWLAITAFTSGCGHFIGSATENLGLQVKQTLLDQDDPETVVAALPAYLILVESLANQDASPKRLLAAAQLYGAYITLLTDDDARKNRLSNKALSLAERGACASNDDLCSIRQLTLAEFEQKIADTRRDDLDALYALGTTWAAWIQANKTDWNAVAQLAHVKNLMQRILALDEHYQNGAPHLYLAVLESLVPPTLGGKPELAKQHFDRAMQMAPDNLLIPVLYARHYARMMFDRTLHDTLLNDALARPASVPGLTLTNTLAQRQARQLLETANQHF